MAISRRKFLSTAAMGGAALATGGLSALLPGAFAGPKLRKAGQTSKVVVVGFGGGCRLSESFGDPSYLPTMASKLFPQGTLYLNCRNELATNHYGGSAAVISGSWQALKAVDNNGPDSPTIFEVYRRTTGLPAGKTWAITQGGNFAYLSRSQGHGYTADESAVTIWSGIATNRMFRNFLGQRAKGATVSFEGFRGPDGEEMNYEGGPEMSDKDLTPRRLLALKRTEEMVNSLDTGTAAYLLGIKDRIKNEPGAGQEDNANLNIALDLLDEMSPDILLVNFGGIDVAHQGYWSKYVKAIGNADRQVAALWDHLQSLPAYRDQTTMFVVPDHGRSADGMGVNGFQHHNGGDEACRRVGMLVMGPETPKNKVVSDKPVYHVDVAHTAAKLLGFTLPATTGTPLKEVEYV